MNTLIAIFIGGGLGSVARYGVSKATLTYFKGEFPLGTLLANLISCAILAAAVFYFAKENNYSESLKALIIIGFCGGFSTFSTFSFETLLLMKEGHMLIAILNIAISIIACVALIWAIAK